MPVSQTFGKLVEGHDGAFYPEIAYVRQKNKVLFFLGESQTRQKLVESLESQLNETFQIVESENDLELAEREDGTKVIKNGTWVVEGPFQRSDVKNANQRTYPRRIWERLIGDSKSSVMQTVRDRGMLGHIEHPKDGRTDGNEGALLITDLKLREDGVVWGTAELLDTPKGKILQEYTRKKVRWGVSSRGNGSVDTSGRVSESDYVVETWDAVMRPSTPGAFPTPAKNSTTEATSPAPVNEAVTEEAKACIASVTNLCQKPLQGLNESSRAALAADLIKASGVVTGLARSKAMPSGNAYDLQDWLNKRLRELSETTVSEKTVENKINEALSGSGEDKSTKQLAAFNRVIESMQTRVRDSVSEVGTLQNQLTEAEAALQKCKTLLTEAESKVKSYESRLAIASDVIAQLSRVNVGNPVEEAIEEAIKTLPALSEVRPLLEGADSLERLEELIDGLLPAAVAAKPRTSVVTEDSPSAVRRNTLPCGSVVSESVKPTTSPVVNPSSGARTAGKIVSAMFGAK